MSFGLSSSDYKTFEDIVVNPLKKAGFKVYIFGSRATGKQTPFSDIDVLLEKPTSGQSSVLSDVKEQIEESRFPIKVDFVLIENLASSYAPRIHREKIEV